MELEGTRCVTPNHAGGAARFGFWVSIVMAVLTVATFALALTALPNKVPYPFNDAEIAAQWPGDYLWLYPAMLLMLVFVAFVAAIHSCTPPARRTYSLLGLSAAVIATAILLSNYYLQATVAPISLQKDQLEGWALLTQYNPNGIFIALEELGYLLMSLTFLCLAPAFAGRRGMERALRWLLTASFVASMLALAAVSAFTGLDRGDSFEVAIISIVWLTLIAAGILAAFVFRRAERVRRQTAEPPAVV